MPDPRAVVDWILEDTRCHAGEVDLLAPDFLRRLTELNRSSGLGVPPSAGSSAEGEAGAGGWVELELLYRLRLEARSEEDLAAELGLRGPRSVQQLAALAVEYLRSRGVPL